MTYVANRAGVLAAHAEARHARVNVGRVGEAAVAGAVLHDGIRGVLERISQWTAYS